MHKSSEGDMAILSNYCVVLPPVPKAACANKISPIIHLLVWVYKFLISTLFWAAFLSG